MASDAVSCGFRLLPGILPWLRRSVDLRGAHREARDEAEECGARGACGLALGGGCAVRLHDREGKQVFRCADEGVAQLDGEYESFGFEDVEAVF